MLETIQQSAISHDRHQVELKLDYQLDRGKHTHYQISTYIFVPRSLGITEESYPKTELYRDIKNYIRIKTPQMSLRDLIEDDLSPLKIVQQVIHQPGWYLKEAQNEQIIHALRLLGAMFKSSLREHINLVERRVRLAAPGQNLQPLVGNLIDEMIVESEKIGAQYRLLYAEFNMPYVQKDVFLAHLLVDEYISLLIEESATEFFKIVSERYEGTDHLHYCQRLNDIIRYDIYRYLRKMDDPVDENLLLRDGKLEVVPSQKVYHINVVSQYSSKSFGNQKIHKRMRLILSRLGIKRIVHIHL